MTSKRVIVCEDDQARVALVTCDLLAMTRDFSDPIRVAVAEIVETDVEHVLTSCTHVHAGPSTLTGTDAIGWPVPAGYRALLVARAGDAAGAAVASLAPVATSFGRALLDGDVAVNRRGYELTPEAQLLVLDPVAVVVNFGIHPTVTGPSNVAVSTDWVGPFRRMIEGRTGYPTVFLQGCQGDVNPSVTSWDDGDPAAWAPAVDAFAGRLASAVTTLVRNAAPIVAEPLRVRTREIVVPVGDTLLAALAGGATERTIELVEWQVGDARVVTVPGEGFHGLQQAMMKADPSPMLLAGLAPDWHGYFPVPYADGYEEGLSFGREAVAELVQALTR